MPKSLFKGFLILDLLLLTPSCAWTSQDWAIPQAEVYRHSGGEPTWKWVLVRVSKGAALLRLVGKCPPENVPASAHDHIVAGVGSGTMASSGLRWGVCTLAEVSFSGSGMPRCPDPNLANG